MGSTRADQVLFSTNYSFHQPSAAAVRQFFDAIPDPADRFMMPATIHPWRVRRAQPAKGDPGSVTTQAIEIPGYVAGIWDIDSVHSHIGFVARHMMLSKVRGRFDRFEGQIVTGEDPLKSSAAVTVDMNSVNTGNEVRDNDLRSGNFFDAANYPTMTYRSTGIRRAGGDLFLDGELTVRGVTRPVPLRFEVNGFASDPGGEIRASFSAAGEINRIEFGVCTNPPIAGLASEKVHLDIEAGAVLRREQG